MPEGDRGARRAVAPKAPAGGTNAMGMAMLMFMPFVMFVTLLLTFAFAYHHHWEIVGLVVGGWFLMTFMFIVINARDRMAGGWYLFLGVLCFVACSSGTIAGLWNYYTHLLQYWSYEENRSYTNVLASEPAAAHADAGKIVFSNSARIDTTRAVGYKVGTTYCVAPILDDQQLDRVEYWAVGVDCCGARGDFACDDSWDPHAKSGVSVVEGPPFLPSRHDYYLKAIATAAAAYGLTSSDSPLLIRWVADPQGAQDDAWRAGIGFLIAASCSYLLLSIIAGAIFQMWSRRSAQASGAAMGQH